MELHGSQLGLLGVVADQRLAEAARQPGLAGAGRALEDQVLLVAPALQDGFETLLGQEAAVGFDVVDAIGRQGRWWRERLRNQGGGIGGGIVGSGGLLIGVAGFERAGAGVGPSFQG